MKEIEWEYMNTDEGWKHYEAETDIGTYKLYVNEANGVYEVEFVSTGNRWEDVCGVYDMMKAMQRVEEHYIAKKGIMP